MCLQLVSQIKYFGIDNFKNMKRNQFYYLSILLVFGLLSSCIIEDEDPEYDIVGAVGTIATIQTSSTTPAVGEAVVFSLTVFSEHEDATELRMQRVSGDVVTVLETKTFATWNKEDSRLEVFNYTVPAGTAGTDVVIEFVIVTESGFTNSRRVTLKVK